MKNAGLSATLGKTAANTGGAHGGIDPAGGPATSPAPAQGSSGAPGTQPPWEGADATDIGATTALPALTHLGGTGSHDPNPGH